MRIECAFNVHSVPIEDAPKDTQNVYLKNYRKLSLKCTFTGNLQHLTHGHK